MRARWLFLPFFLVAATGAHAGLFDDDVARKQIADLRAQTAERLDKLETAAKGNIDLANQIEALRTDLAKLVGQVEVLTYEQQSAQKRQQDFYVDLDTRLRKLEGGASSGAAPAAADNEEESAPAAAPAKADPAAESQEYEAALNLFKAAKYKDAAASLDAFVKKHGDSQLAPAAQYWLGNAYYAQQDYKRAIAAQNQVVAKWPKNPKAPEALLSIAACQQEQGDAKAGKKTLETLVAKYPGSPAADRAKQQLKHK